MAGWSKEQIDTLTNMWNDGASASQIGEKIFKTRNAVIGMSHRLYLPSRPNPVGNRQEKKLDDAVLEERRQRAADRQREHRAREKKAREEAADKVTVMRPRPKSRPRPIDTANVGKFTFAEVVDARTCQWPYGDKPNMTFCGDERKAGKPYCLTHDQMAFREAG